MSDKPLEGKRILWIDDEGGPMAKMILRILNQQTAAEAYFVHITSQRTPFDVLDAFRFETINKYLSEGYEPRETSPDFDLLVSDRQMPGQFVDKVIDRAFELVDGVYRPRPEYADSIGGIVVAATAFPEMTELENGGILSVQKPYNPTQLVQTLERAIQHYESLR